MVNVDMRGLHTGQGCPEYLFISLLVMGTANDANELESCQPLP